VPPRARPAPLLVALGAAALAFPAGASAHTVDIEYRFPLPVWLYALAGGVAVLASAPAAALGLRRERDWTSRDLYPLVRRLRLGRVGLVLTSALFLVSVAGGLFGSDLFFENPATIVFVVDFWVGLGLVSILVGNVWDFVNPLSALGRALERRLAARGVRARPYPEWLGVWPSIGFLLAWTWIELVWTNSGPRTLALLALGYVVWQLAAMAAFGTEVWLERGELFTVVARTFARFAPLELYVVEPAGPCRARRLCEGERRGCASCWLDADPARRRVRLRPFGAGVRREASLLAGGGTLVLALLATVVYDGFARTERYLNLEAFFLLRSDWLGFHDRFLTTLIMLAIVAAFALAFLGVVALVGRAEREGTSATARRYAPTLIPIAAVYFVSHYFVYLIFVGQFTPAVVLDPFEQEWIPDYGVWTGIPGSAVWYAQVGLIVFGHVVSVFEAHRVSRRPHAGARAALAAQTPLLLLMVAYTASGLWVLGQALRAP